MYPGSAHKSLYSVLRDTFIPKCHWDNAPSGYWEYVVDHLLCEFNDKIPQLHSNTTLTLVGKDIVRSRRIRLPVQRRNDCYFQESGFIKLPGCRERVNRILSEVGLTRTKYSGYREVRYLEPMDYREILLELYLDYVPMYEPYYIRDCRIRIVSGYDAASDTLFIGNLS